MKRRSLYLVIIFLFILMLVTTQMADAQCAMCNATASTSNEGNKESALALNRGILFLMAIPYILLSSMLLIWYNYSKQRRSEQNE